VDRSADHLILQIRQLGCVVGDSDEHFIHDDDEVCDLGGEIVQFG
jgi:hypothetical protein